MYFLHRVFLSVDYRGTEILRERDCPLSGSIGKTARLHSLIFENYRHEVIYAALDRSVALTSDLSDIDEVQQHAIGNFFCNYECNYTPGTMTVILSTAVNLEASTYKSTVHNKYCKKLRKEGYYTVKCDG